MATRNCPCTNQSGGPCRAWVKSGATHCSLHSPDPAARARHVEQSRKGGLVGLERTPLPAVAPVGVIDAASLESLAGLRRLLAGTLAKLAQLPIDTRTGTTIGQVATAQRALIEGSDIEERLTKLEAGQPALKLHKGGK